MSVGKILDPDFDPNAAIRRNITNITSQHLHKGATKGSVMNSLLEMKDFVAGLPSKVNRIMDALANHELEVKVKAVDANLVMEGLQKIANRCAPRIDSIAAPLVAPGRHASSRSNVFAAPAS